LIEATKESEGQSGSGLGQNRENKAKREANREKIEMKMIMILLRLESKPNVEENGHQEQAQGKELDQVSPAVVQVDRGRKLSSRKTYLDSLEAPRSPRILHPRKAATKAQSTLRMRPATTRSRWVTPLKSRAKS
jgi:hypothetical protein